MSNPFEPPRDGAAPTSTTPPPPARTPGDFDVGLAFSDGVASVRRSLGAWFAVVVLFVVIGAVSALFCLLPLVVTLPLMMVGWARFALQAADGRAEVRTFLSGFDDLGRWLGPALVLGLLLLLIDLPGMAASQAAAWGLGTLVPTALPDPNDMRQVLAVFGQQLVIGQVAGLAVLVWQALVQVHFLPAVFLLVERGTDPVQSLSDAWVLTKRTSLKLAVVVVLLYFVGLAATVIGAALCLVGLIPLGILSFSFDTAVRASVYRQLTGTRVG